MVGRVGVEPTTTRL